MKDMNLKLQEVIAEHTRAHTDDESDDRTTKEFQNQIPDFRSEARYGEKKNADKI